MTLKVCIIFRQWRDQNFFEEGSENITILKQQSDLIIILLFDQCKYHNHTWAAVLGTESNRLVDFVKRFHYFRKIFLSRPHQRSFQGIPRDFSRNSVSVAAGTRPRFFFRAIIDRNGSRRHRGSVARVCGCSVFVSRIGIRAAGSAATVAIALARGRRRRARI